MVAWQDSRASASPSRERGRDCGQSAFADWWSRIKLGVFLAALVPVGVVFGCIAGISDRRRGARFRHQG
jgi:hypothetical protein